MPLTHVARLFPEIVHTEPKVLVHERGWLYAQTCQTWWADSPEADPVDILLVYKSPRVKATRAMYKPVADMLLGANRLEVIGQGKRFDTNMIHGDKGADYLVTRMTQANEFPGGGLDMDLVREKISAAVHDVLGVALAAA
ncbi:hypothetical protein 40AC_73 [Mycobacterium phage 40AC]|uniref:Uncharacterized protein n=1 Tax=Mycobacterium phage 40AC TaxID=1458717 RepID=W8EGF2_9CAUD|nr:hypothetical protein ST40AC_73 [Mycobacterium phage 40AC]AHJ86436.1 hypothetical protein 40AC_73 [Mycobacterium phage 40AC]